jgi:multicomponent Na+:H+ antiporter subunit G
VSWLEIATLATLFSGVAFYAAGSLGLLRFPDPHARLHALTKADNVGLGLVALAAALHWGTLEQAAKIALVWLFAILAAGTTAQLMADAARRDERDAGGRSEAGPE